MNNTPAIRQARAEDLPSIVRLLGGLAEALGDASAFAADVAALERYGFGDTRVYHARIAADGDNDIGIAVYFPEFSTWRCASGLYVQDLYVDPAARGRGTGRALLASALRHARDAWDADYLRLAVHVLNRDAFDFYRVLGFSADPDNRVMLLDGDGFQRLAGH
ncbi:MAG: GNAT family N-acetyltransferase [Gammaproteobacteria bacterium]|nr:GNAT family N-acetyltransferase [Gammaproteobacteria bacterium]